MCFIKDYGFISTIKNSIAGLQAYFQLSVNSLKSCIVSFSTELGYFYEWLKAFPINHSFLSDVNSYTAVIIGLWIPLSLEIITRISDRYKSEVIVNAFENRWISRWLPKIFIINLCFFILLHFFIPDEKSSDLVKLLLWIALILFFVSVAVLALSIKMLKEYTYKTDDVLEGLLNNVNEIFK